VTVIGVGFRGNARSYETFTCRFLAFGAYGNQTALLSRLV
jgi:hypothetical protein